MNSLLALASWESDDHISDNLSVGYLLRSLGSRTSFGEVPNALDTVKAWVRFNKKQWLVRDCCHRESDGEGFVFWVFKLNKII